MTAADPRAQAHVGSTAKPGGRRDAVRRWTGRIVFAAAAAVLAHSAVFTLRNGLKGLLQETPGERSGGWGGAVDLMMRHRETQQWFAGQHVTSDSPVGDGSLSYPPATYAIAWPLLGWQRFGPTRALWAAASLAALAWLGFMTARHTGASGPLQVLATALLPFALDGTRVCLANGQFAILLLPALATGVLLLARGQPDWRRDLLGSALVLAALAKPSFAAPFFLVLLVSHRRLRPALLVAGGYAALTALAISFRPNPTSEIFRDWLRHSYRTITSPVGSANLDSWLVGSGLGAWTVPASMLALAALAAWLFFRPVDDPWVGLGVTGIVARTWMYHSGYDDVLLVPAMIALIRVCAAADATPWRRAAAAVLLVMTWASVTGLYWFWGFSRIPGWPDTRGIVWLLVLAFLASGPARTENRIGAPREPARRD